MVRIWVSSSGGEPGGVAGSSLSLLESPTSSPSKCVAANSPTRRSNASRLGLHSTVKSTLPNQEGISSSSASSADSGLLDGIGEGGS